MIDKYNDNIIVNHNTGEIFNCQKEDIYFLYTNDLLRYNDDIKCYMFLNKNRKKILNNIISNFRIGINVHHKKYKYGKISKFLPNGNFSITYDRFISLSSFSAVINNTSGNYEILD